KRERPCNRRSPRSQYARRCSTESRSSFFRSRTEVYDEVSHRPPFLPPLDVEWHVAEAQRKPLREQLRSCSQSFKRPHARAADARCRDSARRGHQSPQSGANESAQLDVAS